MPDLQSRLESWEVLDLLASLVQKSLVLYEEDEAGQGRYRLLEPTRQYARDRLLEVAEAEAVRGRHAEHFLQLAEQAEPQLRGPEQRFWAERLEAEHDNLRAALTWLGAAAERTEAQLRLAGAMGGFWGGRGYFREARQWAEAALSRGRDATAPIRVKALLAAGGAALQLGDSAAADALLGESVALARAAGQPGDLAHSLFNWAMVALGQGEYGRATARAQECRTLADAVGDPFLRAMPLLALGLAALHQDDPVSARSFLEESLALVRSAGGRFATGRVTAHLGEVALVQGERERAGVLYREALIQCREAGDQRFIAGCLSGLAAVAAPRQPERAARLFGAAEALREALGSPHATVVERGGYDEDVAALRDQLDEATFATAWAEGRAMPLEQAVALALEDASHA